MWRFHGKLVVLALLFLKMPAALSLIFTASRVASSTVFLTLMLSLLSSFYYKDCLGEYYPCFSAFILTWSSCDYTVSIQINQDNLPALNFLTYLLPRSYPQFTWALQLLSTAKDHFWVQSQAKPLNTVAWTTHLPPEKCTNKLNNVLFTIYVIIHGN